MNMDEVEEVLAILGVHGCNEIEELYTLAQKHCIVGVK
jgi:hypothetical protein